MQSSKIFDDLSQLATLRLEHKADCSAQYQNQHSPPRSTCEYMYLDQIGFWHHFYMPTSKPTGTRNPLFSIII